MAPTETRRHFLVGVGRIDNKRVGARGEHHGAFVEWSLAQFNVGDVSGGMAVIFDSIAGGATGMAQRHRAHRHAGTRRKLVAGAEIMKFQMRAESLDLDRKQRKAHYLPDRVFDTFLLLEM